MGLVVNAIDAAIDTHKVLYSFSRPTPRGGEGIGAWIVCFEAYVVASAVTNLAVCIFTYQGPLLNNLVTTYPQRLVLFICCTYGLFALKWIIAVLIPDRTWSSHIQLQRRAYLVNKHVLGIKDSVTRRAVGGEGLGSAGSAAAPFALFSSYSDLRAQEASEREAEALAATNSLSAKHGQQPHAPLPPVVATLPATRRGRGTDV